MGQKVISVKYGEGMLCNELWRINTGSMDDSVTQDPCNCVHALNHTTDSL